MARRYNRDARGRFASTGSSRSKAATGGTLAVRASLTRSRRKADANPSPAQRGAVTRAANKAKRTKQDNTKRITGINQPGRFTRSARAKQQQPVPTSGNYIRPTGRKAPRNNVRAYRPATPDGQIGRIDRQIDKSMKEMTDSIRSMSQAAKKAKPKVDKMGRQLERMNAKAIAGRLKKGITGELAGMELGIMGGKTGAKAIKRRMARAADAAARGSKAGAKAQGIYANQLAFMGSGKPKAGKNNLRPGPRNTKGTPKRKRRRKPR